MPQQPFEESYDDKLQDHNNQHESLSEEEYQLQDDDSSTSEYNYGDAGEAQNTPNKKFNITKLITTSVIVVVMVGCVYAAVHFVRKHTLSKLANAQSSLPELNSKNSGHATPKSTQDHTIPAHSIIPSHTTMPTPTHTTIPHNTDKLDSAHSIETLTQHVRDNENLITQLQQSEVNTQHQLSDMQSSMRVMQQEIQNLNRTINTATTQFKAMMMEREQEKMAAALAAQRRAAEARRKLRYYVQAVIPGRAWLKSINGQTLTVAVGDNIPGYGAILSIDPYNGNIMTGSGEIIRYGVNQNG